MAAATALSAGACDFYFNYDSVSAPVGIVGEIGIRVQKTHNQCTLSSMDEYAIDGSGVQILAQTAWENLGNNLYETWIQVSLSEVGEGWLRISKTCTKEGYEEAVLPISILEPGAEDVWTLAWSGSYPYQEPAGALSVVGQPSVGAGILSVAGISADLPEGASLPELPEEIRLYYTEVDGNHVPLLIVGDGLLVRFDHLVS